MVILADKADSLVLLNAALDGLKLQRIRIDKQIELLEEAVSTGDRNPAVMRIVSLFDGSASRPHRLSSEGRQKISAAQKKRWDSYRKDKKKRRPVT
jgi:hypothetical protein